MPLDQILKKLSDQVSLAKEHQQNPELCKQYISRAQMLCELILEEPKKEQVRKDLTIEEQSVPQTPTKQVTLDDSALDQQSIKAADLPGDSIFDF